MDNINTTERKTICCCCSPKTWTRIVGWLELIGCIVGISVVTTFMAIGMGANDRQEKVSSSVSDPTDDVYAGSPVIRYTGVLSWRQLLLLISAIVWIFLGLAIIMILLLLLGNEKERRGFFIPWFIFSWIGTILTVIGVSGYIYYGACEVALSLVGGLAISGFCLYVVHQRYSQIGAINRNRNVQQQQQRTEAYEKVHQDDEV